MKKWLLAAGLGLALATSAQAADKIAIVNMGSLFQQVAQKTGVSNTLLFEQKVFTGVSGTNVIRLLPPLCLTMADADEFIGRFRKVLV